MVVSDPLFESFIKAAGSKGFFHEKKVARDEDGGLLGPEEEERRQRMLYEAKYRKVVAKFRSKLAVREEQLMVNGVGGGGHLALLDLQSQLLYSRLSARAIALADALQSD